MLKPIYSKRFDRDVKKMGKRGNALKRLKKVIRMLIRQEKLDERYKNHPLT
ncbi:type II toxin-antitoxin system mRNA interferase toxin, RelE/StbE family [Desulfococcaceae bacterium HSG9]|nr:type II toxin-antitoxin system mRNA interferase toxin, RelE/StbE family [Desulfococcaceae bacterium HSG9]